MGRFQKIEDARNVPPAYNGPSGMGCWDTVAQQWAPWGLCGGWGMEGNPGNNTPVSVIKSKVTFKNFLGSENANMKTNAVYAGSMIALGLTGFFLGKKSGKPEIGVLIGAGVGLAGGMVINSLIKK